MNPIRRLARLLLFLTLSTLTRAADLPRVAVVPDSPEPSVAAFADFLSVSLASASNQYTLVERAELTRLASEAEIQKLAADQRPAALAKLAKADGLIIVGTDKGDPKLPKLTLRLTSTNNGLVLRSLILGGKEAEYPKAAELAAGVLRFPCERLAHGDMKPPVIVSLLGIRPAFEIDRALETTLNLAVAQQLSAQSGIAVSERWKMHDLVFERSLADEKPQSFATGTVLLDGSYTRKGDQLEFTLRLRKAEDEAGKTLTLQGPANKPADLAQQIAKLIATEAGQSGEVVAWDAVAEGKQYGELGWWLFKRKLGKEAAQAYETAIALGLVEGIALRGRIWSYQEIVDSSDRYTPSRTKVDGLDRLPKQEFKGKLMSAIRMTQLAVEALDTNWGGVSLKEFDMSGRHFLLIVTLNINLKVLQATGLRGEQLELATEARTLRALCRDLVAKGESIRKHFACDVTQRFYMYETPKEAAAELRRLLSPEYLVIQGNPNGRMFRSWFWQTGKDSNLWHFVDWTSTDNRRGDEAWGKFIGELLASDILLQQADGHAFAFQISKDPKEQEDILKSYCKLLDQKWDELLTSEGQRIFFGFNGYFPRYGNDTTHPFFDRWLASRLTRIFESGKWIEPATIMMANSAVLDWKDKTPDGDLVIPESLALPMLTAVENYIQWAKSDPRWKQQYENPKFGKPVEFLLKIPEKIILANPELKEQRIKARPSVAGAVPIRAWKPEGPGLSDSENWLFGRAMISSGDSLYVPMINQGVIELDVRQMVVKRVMGLPLPGFNYIGGISCDRKSMIMNIDDRLFSCPLVDDGNSWSEILTPGVAKEDKLIWCVRGFEEEFFVGSCMIDSNVKSPRMLAGMARDGALNWLASSSRRPALNPLDELNPRSVFLAYRNPAGKTIMLLGRLRDDGALLVELESGRRISSLGSSGVAQMRGEKPLYWNFDKEGVNFLFAFDSDQEQPRLLFKSNKVSKGLPEIWKDVRPLYDASKSEFRGKCIAAIVHGEKLWILKREPEVSGKFDKNDPQAFRLVCAGLNGGEAVTIPLRYDVSAEIRKLADKAQFKTQSSLELPIINGCSLTATPKGLFFASSGDENDFWTGDRPVGGDLAPVLLYITWDDINAWLAKNAPESAKPASP